MRIALLAPIATALTLAGCSGAAPIAPQAATSSATTATVPPSVDVAFATMDSCMHAMDLLVAKVGHNPLWWTDQYGHRVDGPTYVGTDMRNHKSIRGWSDEQVAAAEQIIGPYPDQRFEKKIEIWNRAMTGLESYVAVGVQQDNLTTCNIVVPLEQRSSSDLSSIGAPSPSAASVATSPPNSTTPATAAASSPTSTPSGPAALGGPSSAPAPSTQAPQYAPTGTYDVAANTGSTLTFQSYNAKGQIALSNWVRSAKSASGFSTPAPEKRWVAFKVNIENTGTTPLSYNGLGFILIDKEGYRYRSGGATDVTAGPRLSSGELAPGEKTTGYVVTEVPTNASIVELKMDPTYGNGSWALK